MTTSSVRLKHEQISGVLAREIQEGRPGRGSRLPGEVALAERFGVSRTTVRAALAELAGRGLIATRTGKGSFVLYGGRPVDASNGWARALAPQGVASTARVVAITRRHDPATAERLGLAVPEVVVVERVHELDDGSAAGRAVSYERATVPAVGTLRDLPDRGLVTGSLTDELERAGLRPHHGRQRVRARAVDPHEASVLGCRAGELWLHVRRTSLSADDGLVQEVDSILDPGHFELVLTFEEC